MKKSIFLFIHQFYWELLSTVLVILLFVNSLVWVVADKAPPAWDDGMYLNVILTDVMALKEGIKPFINTVLNGDPGRVPLGSVLAVPLGIIFSSNELSAMITLNFCWFAIGWGLFYIGKSIFSRKVGFWSILLTALLPIYQYITHFYLIDFYLVTFVVLTVAAVLLNLRNDNKYFWLLGIFMGMGMLVKVTFPIFVIGPILVYIVYFFRRKEKIFSLKLKMMMAMLIGAMIVFPYIFHNFQPLLKQSMSLNSPELAALYNMKNPFSWNSFSNFLKTQFQFYMGVTVGIGAVLGLFIYIYNRKCFGVNKYWYLSILLSWVIPAVFIFGFGYIQDGRYFMPALPVAVFLTAYVFSLTRRLQWLFLLAIFPAIFMILTSTMWSELFFKIKISAGDVKFGYEVPDRRDWKTNETISSLNNVLDLYSGDNQNVLFLGGNREYHIALFTYVSRLQNNQIYFSALPYYAQQNMTANEAIDYIKDNKFLAIIYKTGVNWPEFSSKNDKKIVEYFDNNPNEFKKVSLGVLLPDGNEYFVYFRIS
jgi:hypothetical protein